MQKALRLLLQVVAHVYAIVEELWPDMSIVLNLYRCLILLSSVAYISSLKLFVVPQRSSKDSAVEVLVIICSLNGLSQSLTFLY